MTKNSFYIKTLGCKVNQYESQVIRERFLNKGYVEAVNMDKADVFVVNTCTVTSTSDSKSLRFIRNAINRNKCVVAAGCMIEDKDLDLNKLVGARFIIKNKDKYKIPYIISRIPDTDKCKPVSGIKWLKERTRAFVKIQDGCNNACSYCKVRIVRGRSISRPFKEVLDESRGLIKNGTKEIVLTGICLGSYGKDISKDMDLSSLIEEICKIEGDWRLRLSSIEPKDIGDGLIQKLQTQKKLCKHLHIPFQSGDDGVLKRMNRPYTRKDYLGIVYKLRQAIHDIAISTDIMVGFPGETENDFQNTLSFIKEARPMRIHVFMFSKRKGTPSFDYKDATPFIAKKEREGLLLRFAGELSIEFADRFVGRRLEVLVEDKRSSEGSLQGYTDRYFKLFIDGPDALKGQLLMCRPTLTNGKAYGILSPHVI